MKVSPEDLLLHADWLRGLARSLVRDAGADDLVQETWLAALRRPPEDDRPVRPWLAQVVRNFARMGFRGEKVRRDKVFDLAHAQAPDDLSAEALLGRFETSRLLTRVVAELDEPYRSTILYRYYEGLTAAKIARLQEVPAGTVRWRLKTGLDRIRAALDLEASGDRRRWCLALVPLVKGMVIMSRTAKLGAMIALLLLLGGGAAIWIRSHGHPAPPGAPETQARAKDAPQPPARRPTPEAPDSHLVATTGDPNARVAMVAAKAVPDRDAPSGVIAGRVVNWASGRGVPAAQVTFSVAETTLSVIAGADGTFRFDPPRPGRYRLQVVSAPDFLPFAPEFGQSPVAIMARPGVRIEDILIYLSPAIDYRAHVTDPDGKPIAGADVHLLGVAAGEQALSPIADRFVTDAKGEIIFHAPDYAILEARKSGFTPGRGVLDGPAQVSHRVEIQLVPGSDNGLGTMRLAGHVLDDSGAPVAGATVRAHQDVRRADLQPSAQADSDDDGKFVLTGLDPGGLVVDAKAEGHAPATIAGVAAGTEDSVIKLAPGGVLVGRVVDGGGAPVSEFNVVVLRKDGLRQTELATVSVIDAEGRFEVDTLPPGDVLVMATAHGFAPSPRLPAHASLAASDQTPVEIKLGVGGTLTGTVADAQTHAPLEYARVTVEGISGTGSTALPIGESVVTDAQGSFSLSGLAPGLRTIIIGAYAHDVKYLSGLTFSEGVGTGPVTIELTPTADGEQPKTEVAGIGVQVTAATDAIIITGLLPGSGAGEAGLQINDAILAVNATPVLEIGFEDALQAIRGPVGTSVMLTIRRGDKGAPFVVQVFRRMIHA